MWTPLPQILEQCLHQIYSDRGWNLVSNTNSRLPEAADPSIAFPTLRELVIKVDAYMSQLGYDDRVKNDLREALLTRLKSLMVGATWESSADRSFSRRRKTGYSTILVDLYTNVGRLCRCGVVRSEFRYKTGRLDVFVDRFCAHYGTSPIRRKLAMLPGDWI